MNEATNTKRATMLDELELSDEQVINFLEQHLDFFNIHPEILGKLVIPHPAQGQSVSLIERQVLSLREENNNLKQQLTLLVNNARENDELLEKTKTLIISLISAHSFEQLTLLVEGAMTREFGSVCSRLWRIVETESDLEKQQISAQDAHIHLKRIVRDQHPNCGILKDKEKQLIFADQADQVGSAATIPLFNGDKLVGILSIGNSDADYYRNNMSTSLLSFIGKAIARLLRNLSE